MNLYEKLCNEIINYTRFWNYYGDININSIFSTEREASKFINDFFQSGSKSYVLGDSFISMQNIRNKHSVNVFFIGAMLQRIIDDKLSIRSKGINDYPFSYLWYLTALAHDLGYSYEKCSNYYLETKSENRNYGSWFYGLDKKRFLYRRRWYLEHGLDIIYLVPSFANWRNVFASWHGNIIGEAGRDIWYNNNTVVKKTRYSGKLIDNYFVYRILKMQKVDHGIVGADMLYSKLLVNYVKEYNKTCLTRSRMIDFNDFCNTDERHFCREQFKIFAYIADCVASHNIYKCSENSEDELIYKKYYLEELLSDNFKKISYAENPLLFILCVADTIEPLKKFEHYDSIELMKHIWLDYDKISNELNVSIDNDLYESSEGKLYLNAIKELEKWCEIKVNVGCATR